MVGGISASTTVGVTTHVVSQMLVLTMTKEMVIPPP